MHHPQSLQIPTVYLLSVNAAGVEGGFMLLRQGVLVVSL